MIRKLIQCMDLRSVPLGLATVFAGLAAAGIHGNFEPLPAVLTILFVIFALISANLYYRFCDAKYGYGETIDQGIRDTGAVPMATVLREACLAFTLVAVLFGIGIMTMTSFWVILLGIAMYGVSYFNSAGPWPLARTPWNWLPAFLFFGPVGVVATCFVQADYEGVTDLWFDISPAIFLGCAVGLFAVNTLFYYNYVNMERDKLNGKRTFTVTFGRRATSWVFITNTLVIYGCSAFVVFANHLQFPWLILTIPFICICALIWLWVRMIKGQQKYTVAIGWIINTIALLYALTAFFIFVSNKVGYADDSVMRIF